MQDSAQEISRNHGGGLAPGDQAGSQVKRRSNGTYAPGQSGNPKRHAQWLARERQRVAYEAQLLGDIISEAGGELSALDLGFAKQAAAMLAKATFSKGKADVLVRLTRCAAQLIDRIKINAKVRQEASPVTAFDQYLKQKAGS